MRCTQRPTVLLCHGKLPIRCFQRSQDADLPTRKLHRSSIADSSIKSAQKTTLVQSTNGAVPGIWRPSQQLHDYVMLQKYFGPNCARTPKRTKHNRLTQCQQRGAASKYVRHVSNGWTAVARPPRGFHQTSTTAAQRLTPTMF